MILSSCSSRERSSSAGLPGDPREPPADAGLAALGQLHERVPGDADHRGFRHHGLFPAHVRHRVHPAAVRERLGLRQQALEVSGAVPGGVHDLLAELEHLRRGFEPALPVGLQQRGGGEFGQGFQGAGGIQHIRGGRSVLGHIPHGVAQHGGNPVLGGELEHPHRVGGAQRLPGRAELADHLGGDGSWRHGVQPAFEQGAGAQVAPAAHGPSDVGVRSDQHGQHRLEGFRVQGAGGQFGPGHGDGHRSPGLARGAGMGIGDQPAQRPVAGAVVVPVGQHDDASPDLGAEVAVVVKDRKVHPDDRVQPGRHAGLQVLDRPVEAVAVRAGERRRPVRGGGGGQLLRPGDPVVGAEGGGDVEMGEAHADSGFRDGSRASWIRSRRQRPLPTCRVRSRVRLSGSGRICPAAAPGPARSRGPRGPGRSPAAPAAPPPTIGGAHTSGPVRRRRCSAGPPSRARRGWPEGAQTTSTDSLNMPIVASRTTSML